MVISIVMLVYQRVKSEEWVRGEHWVRQTNEAFAQIKKPFPPKRHATSNQSITESIDSTI